MTRLMKLLTPLLYGLICLFARIVKRHRVVCDAALRDLRGPLIVLGNHSSFYDFVYMIHAVFPRRLRFVVARKYFCMPGLGALLRVSGAIPKSLFQADIGAAREMLRLLKRGENLALFPEGQISMHGRPLPPTEGVEKLIKRAEVPVAVVRTGGGYFLDPPWSKRKFHGRSESEARLLLTAGQVRELSCDEILERVTEALNVDQYDWKKHAGACYRGKGPAEGLENILYLCPQCGGKHFLCTEKDSIRCTRCGLLCTVTDGFEIRCESGCVPKNIGLWYDLQRIRALEEVRAAQGVILCEPVTLAMFAERGIAPVGGGTLTLDGGVYLYRGTQHGKQTDLAFSTSSVRFLPYDAGDNFQIYHRNLLYEFRPENPSACSQFAVYGEAAHLYAQAQKNAQQGQNIRSPVTVR